MSGATRASGTYHEKESDECSKRSWESGPALLAGLQGLTGTRRPASQRRVTVEKSERQEGTQITLTPIQNSPICSEPVPYGRSSDASHDLHRERIDSEKMILAKSNAGTVLAVENCAQYSFLELPDLSTGHDGPSFGVSLDPVNSLGAGEGIGEGVETLLSHTACLHWRTSRYREPRQSNVHHNWLADGEGTPRHQITFGHRSISPT